MAAVAVSSTGGTAGRLSPRRGGFRRYLVAAVLVRLADEGARVALVLLALQRTQSAAIGALLVASLLIPHVVAAPIVGLLTDRVRQPRWILTTAAAGFAASLAVTSACLGRLPVWVTVVVLLAGGCGGPALTGGLRGIAGPAVAAGLAHAWFSGSPGFSSVPASEPCSRHASCAHRSSCRHRSSRSGPA